MKHVLFNQTNRALHSKNNSEHTQTETACYQSIMTRCRISFSEPHHLLYCAAAARWPSTKTAFLHTHRSSALCVLQHCPPQGECEMSHCIAQFVALVLLLKYQNAYMDYLW